MKKQKAKSKKQKGLRHTRGQRSHFCFLLFAFCFAFL